MVSDVTGRMTFIHKLNLYIHSILESQIRLYEWLLQHLSKSLLDSIGILSTGHLPPLLLPPKVLENITTNAIQLVHRTHPDYVLAIKHITEYYDMKLATFGVDSDGNMIVAFPVFVKDHTSKPKTLFKIETKYPSLTIIKLPTAILKSSTVNHTYLSMIITISSLESKN